MTSSSMYNMRYAPGMLYTATSLPSFALITSVSNNDSNDMVGGVSSFFLIFVICPLLSVHALPLIELCHFSYRKIYNIRDSLFYSQVSDSYSRVSMASLFCI